VFVPPEFDVAALAELEQRDQFLLIPGLVPVWAEREAAFGAATASETDLQLAAPGCRVEPNPGVFGFADTTASAGSALPIELVLIAVAALAARGNNEA
jgi:hypothetical protein